MQESDSTQPPSTFFVLRIVAMMLGADGPVEPSENQWFQHLIKNYELTSKQQEMLQQDLKGVSPELESIFDQLTDPDDRKRLLNWARLAMNIDGRVHPDEQKLYHRLLKMDENARMNPIPTSTYEMGRSVLKAEKEKQFWRDLEDAGNFYSQSIRFRGYRYVSTRALMMGLTSRNRFIYGLAGLFFLLLLLALLFIL